MVFGFLWSDQSLVFSLLLELKELPFYWLFHNTTDSIELFWKQKSPNMSVSLPFIFTYHLPLSLLLIPPPRKSTKDKSASVIQDFSLLSVSFEFSVAWCSTCGQARGKSFRKSALSHALPSLPVWQRNLGFLHFIAGSSLLPRAYTWIGGKMNILIRISSVCRWNMKPSGGTKVILEASSSAQWILFFIFQSGSQDSHRSFFHTRNHSYCEIDDCCHVSSPAVKQEESFRNFPET